MRSKDYFKIGNKKVFIAHRELIGDFCEICFGTIYKGQWYRKTSQKTVRHYKCDEPKKTI